MLKTLRFSNLGFAISIGLSAFSANPTFADAPTPGPSGHSSLFDNVSLQYSNVVQGTNFPYYSQAERVQTITDLIQSIQSDYSLLLYKQHTLGVDIVQIGQAAVATEQSIADVTDVNAQALGNLQFLDRVRKITANFQDSHFQLDGVDTPSPISLGFVVSNIGGKYLVTTLRPNYLANKTLNFDYTQQIQLGDELVSIDGQDPLTAAQALEPYLPASSELYRMNSAIFSLTSRDFNLPTQANSAVVLRRNGSTISLSLPWGAAQVTRTDQATYLKNIGVPVAIQNLGLNAASVFGEDWRMKIGALKNEVDFADVSDLTTPVVTIGTLDSPAGPVAYLQVQTYEITAVAEYQPPAPPAPTPSSAPASAAAKKARPPKGSVSGQILSALAKLPKPTALPNFAGVHTILDTGSKPQGLIPVDPSKMYAFGDFIDIVISTFKAQSMPLILDIRYNPGGDIGDAMALVTDLTKTNGTIAPISQMFRITNLAWESIDAAVAQGIADPTHLDPSSSAVAATFTVPRANGADYSEILPSNLLANDKTVGGYDQKIVVLTSSFCVSACDATALMLKSSGRATLLGEPTNGTGAGFFSTFEVPDFTDTNNIVIAHLPNSLFGRPLQPNEDPTKIAVESIEAENHPTQPDVPFAQTMVDVQNGNSDLITAAISQVTSK